MITLNTPFTAYDLVNISRIFETAEEIFFDMDNVLVDFSGHYQKLTNKSWNKSDNDRWENITDWNDFFLNAPPLPIGVHLWSIAKHHHKPIVLGAIRGDKVECMDSKLRWSKRILGSDTRITLVNHPELKKYLSAKKRVLVDDSKKNCYDWELLGGTAIHIGVDSSTL